MHKNRYLAWTGLVAAAFVVIFTVPVIRWPVHDWLVFLTVAIVMTPIVQLPKNRLKQVTISLTTLLPMCWCLTQGFASGCWVISNWLVDSDSPVINFVRQAGSVAVFVAALACAVAWPASRLLGYRISYIFAALWLTCASVVPTKFIGKLARNLLGDAHSGIWLCVILAAMAAIFGALAISARDRRPIRRAVESSPATSSLEPESPKWQFQGGVGLIFSLLVFSALGAASRSWVPDWTVEWPLASFLALLFFATFANVLHRAKGIFSAAFYLRNRRDFLLAAPIAGVSAAFAIFLAWSSAGPVENMVFTAWRTVFNPEWRVRVDGTEIQVSGPFRAGIAKAIRRSLKEQPGIRMVSLTSHGGDLDEAGDAARAVETAAVATRVITECESACTLVFLAGRERFLLPPGRMGFHNCTTPSEVAYIPCDSVARHKLESLYLRYGVEPSFVERAVATPPDGMWYPSPKELLEAHVITGTHFKLRSELTPEESRQRDMILSSPRIRSGV